MKESDTWKESSSKSLLFLCLFCCVSSKAFVQTLKSENLRASLSWGLEACSGL